ncbi:FemAB family XrtA/PEP-CTERM system-associated protein [Pseudomonadota bacterium]
MITMHLLRIDASNEGRWNDYVTEHATTVTDLSGWRRVLKNTYGMQSHVITVEEHGAIAGTLVLFEIKHPVFGHYLTTGAFATDGGLYFDRPEAIDLLTGEARRLADKLQVDYLLIRTRGLQIKGFLQDTHYKSAVIDLRSGEDSLWRSTLRAKTRNQVRKGINEGFTIHTGHEQVFDFYRVFSEHMRDLGSPVHSLKLYKNIIRYLGDHARFIVVKEGKELVAGALLLEINGIAMNLHTVALKKYNRRCPNYLLYWDMIKSSCERGNSVFDMGRSEAESTNLKFKTNWGAQVVELNYNYYMRNHEEVPYLDPRNPRYRWPIAIWRKLPVPLTRFLGPYLIRGIA